MSLVSKSSLVNLWVKLCIGTIPCVLKWESLFKVSHWYYWCVLYRIGNALYISLSIQKQTFHKISVSINFKYNFRKINVDFWHEALHGIAFNMKKKKKKCHGCCPLVSFNTLTWYVNHVLVVVVLTLQFVHQQQSSWVIFWNLRLSKVKQNYTLTVYFFFNFNNMICNHNPNFT